MREGCLPCPEVCHRRLAVQARKIFTAAQTETLLGDAGEPTTVGVAERPDGHELREQRGHERETGETQDLCSADHHDCTRLSAHRCARQTSIRLDFAKQIRPVWRAVEAPSAGTAWPASAATCGPGGFHTELAYPDRALHRRRRWCARQTNIRLDFAKQIRPVWRAVEAPSAGTAWPASAPTCGPGGFHTELAYPDRALHRRRR